MHKLIVCLLLFINSVAFAQVNFQSLPLNEALARARTESKLVFLQFEAADCEHCNDVANKAFENTELANRLDQLFICLKINAQHPDRNTVSATHNLPSQKVFGTLFLDNNGNLLHSYLRTTTFYKEYLIQINKALDKAGEVLQVNEIEKEYKKGNRGYDFLALLLQKRKAAYMPTDDLLEEYINVLPTDSLKSLTTLVFIAKMAPALESRAYKVLHADNILFNRAWYSMSLPVRVNINNTVIRKGIDKAILEKNEQLAVRTAHFAQGTNTNQAAGAKAYDMNLLRYYDEVKDTAVYFRKSIAYYERWLLTVSPDSIKRNDSVNMKRMLAMSKKDTVMINGKMRISTSVSYAPSTQRFARELNNGAYSFFLRTSNPYLLSLAAEWARRSLEFYESPENLDTYAKVLYKQGQKIDALREMEKAVALQKRLGFPTKTFEGTLGKMKAGAALMD